MTHTTLVAVAELEQHLFDHDWCVIDCRHELTDAEAGWFAYSGAHIPGATFAHMDEDLSGAKTGSNGRHPLPSREDLAAVFRDWGIHGDTQIVAYDAEGGSFAVRLWWLARWLGHEKVALLDGGWQAWFSAMRWSSVELPERDPGTFTARDPLVRAVGADDVLAALHAPDRLLIDARAPERYEGRVEPLDPVAGHIPGAINRFWKNNLVGTKFKPAEQLRAEYAELLAGHGADQVILQCGSGVTACHHVLAMEIAGLPGAALYAGSWSEWVADRARPVAVGPNP